MDLAALWFILVSVLFIGFFFLEGFDFGIGILLPFLGKNDTEKRVIINSIGPFWDGNEVWLITAGGAIFAAFPNWYATMFSGFYLALVVVLAALIARGTYFEYRSKKESAKWRNNWDIVMFVSSLLLAILWGTALANLIKGTPIDETMNFTGNFFSLLNIYTLWAGITTLAVFTYHGAIFLSLKTTGAIEERAKAAAKKLGPIALVVAIVLAVLSAIQTDMFKSSIAIVAAIIGLVALVLTIVLMNKGKNKIAMITNGLAIASGVAALFAGLFPRVMVSTLGYDLTITNASSSHYTLTIMTIVALTMVPIVLAYQAWTYWIFRKRVSTKELEY